MEWTGRAYNRGDWSASDPVNRALSSANSCLYGVCHAAIVAAGYSPAIGFIHTGKMLSFVYDIADLYKVEMTIPAAFRAAAEESDNLERQVRLYCRDRFKEQRLLARIVRDIDTALAVKTAEGDEDDRFNADFAAPGGLWDPSGTVEGGENYGEIEEELVDGGPDS